MESREERQAGLVMTFHFDATKCAGWAIFSFVIVIACIILVIGAPNQRFAGDLIPGWLFGSIGAALFSTVGASWLGRALHRGPALELTDAGVIPDRRLGGVVAPRLTGLIRWAEVKGAVAGSHGSVALQLRDPEAFWARQSLAARIMAWRPGAGPRAYVGLGGNELGAKQLDIILALNKIAEERRMTTAAHSDSVLGTHEHTEPTETRPRS